MAADTFADTGAFVAYLPKKPTGNTYILTSAISDLRELNIVTEGKKQSLRVGAGITFSELREFLEFKTKDGKHLVSLDILTGNKVQHVIVKTTKKHFSDCRVIVDFCFYLEISCNVINCLLHTLGHFDVASVANIAVRRQ